METGNIVATEDIEEECSCGNGNTAISGESGAGEFCPGGSGGGRADGEHRKGMQKVHQALNTVCCGQWWGLI